MTDSGFNDDFDININTDRKVYMDDDDSSPIINNRIFPMIYSPNNVYKLFLHVGQQGDCYCIQQRLNNITDQTVLEEINTTTIDVYQNQMEDGQMILIIFHLLD